MICPSCGSSQTLVRSTENEGWAAACDECGAQGAIHDTQQMVLRYGWSRPAKESVAQTLLALAKQQDEARAQLIPTEADAFRLIQQAMFRLRSLGWREDPAYAPKGQKIFTGLVFGALAPSPCCYVGEWPDGSWFAAEAGDLWPCRPVMWKPGEPT